MLDNALNVIYYIFKKMMSSLFVDFNLPNGVNFGYILIIVTFMALVIRNLVVVPRTATGAKASQRLGGKVQDIYDKVKKK